MALDDELLALERRLLERGGARDWLAAIDELRVMLAMGAPGIPAKVAALIPPAISDAVLAGLLEALQLGAEDAYDIIEAAGQLGDEALAQVSTALNPSPSGIVSAQVKRGGVDAQTVKDVRGLDAAALAVLAQVAKLLAAGVDDATLTAPLLQSATQIRAAVTSAVIDAGNRGVLNVTSAADMDVVWIAERNACVRCLKHQGHVVRSGQKFPAGLTFGKYVYDDAVEAPPLHPHCRCHLEPLNAAEYAESLRREAERSVLRGYSLESESMAQRIYAAQKLLDDGVTAPKTVKKAAQAAINRGRFLTRDPYQNAA